MKNVTRASSIGRFLVTALFLGLALLLVTFSLGAAPVARAEGPGIAGANPLPTNTGWSYGRLNLVKTAVLRGDWVAAGVGLRDRGYGTITLPLIPSGSTIQAAYLYWDYIYTSQYYKLTQGVLNGTAITGSLVGQDVEPCWTDGTTNFAYRADVTSIVKTAYGNNNYSYKVSGFWSYYTQGQDPWVDGLNSPPMIDGASLVVFYSNPALPMNGMQLYDGSRAIIGGFNNTYTLTMSGFTAPPTIHKARTTFIMGDGQTQYTPATDTVWFNGTQLPFQFNGADPQDGPNYIYGNLWDTISQDVTSLVPGGSTSATAKVTTAECLVWVAQVLSIR